MRLCRDVKAFYFDKFIQLVVLLMCFSGLSACSKPGYLCPVDTEVGACASQMQTYTQSLYTHAEGESIFTSASNTKAKECATCQV